MGTDSWSLFLIIGLLGIDLLFFGLIVKLGRELVSQATVCKGHLRCKVVLLQVKRDPPLLPNMLYNPIVGREVRVDDLIAERRSSLNRLDSSDIALADEVHPAVEAGRSRKVTMVSISPLKPN